MSVPVEAPRFELNECRDQAERDFVERLHARAEQGDWYADVCIQQTDRLILAVDVSDRERNTVLRTLRVDHVGPHLLLGEDESMQLTTDLVPGRPGVTLVPGGPPADLANRAADWLEREMGRPIVRQVWFLKDWDQLGKRFVAWSLVDEGRRIAWSSPTNTPQGPAPGDPDSTTLVAGRLVQ